ncbi:MAG: Transglutaminase-like superfamily protein [Verrucomicrobia bacterium ADurb.Bin345]|nr:MAG: Transglutaminase-like superfamily protein [Verrucomicrobia bacterium ADurb.Bin345]
MSPERDPAGMSRWLESTTFVQAADEGIVRKARELTGSARDRVEAVLAIHRWVHRNVKKVPAVSLPSAVEVLRHMKGDCNEHTYLFVALARAAGIPAQIRVGLVYLDDAFYYHAWPAVYAGRWWELDPTLGQEAVDATHIALLEGELGAQLQLAGMIGRARATILSQECGSDGRMTP